MSLFNPEIPTMLSEYDKLYTNNTGRKSFQWELWQYCNSLCKFCYLGKDNRIHNKERQHKSLNDLNRALDVLDYSKYNNISLIGGEFFQGQLNDRDTHDLFFSVIKKIFQLYLDKKIGSMWITATITIGDQKHLYELLDLAESMRIFPKEEYGASGLWICTSWDAAGRFHSKEMENNWEYHMKNIKKKYPWIKLNTTIILQQKLIDMYLNEEWSAHRFSEEFSTTLFFKQCGIPSYESDKDRLTAKAELQKRFPFFPTRNSFIRFLIKFSRDDREYFDRLFNIMYRSDELHRNFWEIEHDTVNFRQKSESGPEENGRSTLPCGHTDSYAAYIDGDQCCICDRNVVAENLL